MAVLRITKEFRFEGAHALPGYDGKCRNIHGHSYLMYVTVKGENLNGTNSPKEGMVVDFKQLKAIVNENIVDVLDHALIMHAASPLSQELAQAYPNVIMVDFQPSTENLICWFAQVLSGKLPQGVELFSIKLYETAGSFAEWYASDNI
ncbi:MAG: 6-carboxytetrahydropterin synthase [Bacteroidales bacterium]|jgi:6-pyruvoyltetrahydropterin/6-carboxytetrahydropterin synthase|nr:6-carboxytetrahydropterin synthase [Bacteroidales bacterium]